MQKFERTKEEADRLTAGLWGLLVASAFGQAREAMRKDPPSDAHIRHRIPGMSWGIEGAQVLCLLTALQRSGAVTQEWAERAVDWARLGIYFPESEHRFIELDGPLVTPHLHGESYAALEGYHRQAIKQSALLFMVPFLRARFGTDVSLGREMLALCAPGIHDDMDKATLIAGMLWSRALVSGHPNAWHQAAFGLGALAFELNITKASVDTVLGTSPGGISYQTPHRLLYLLVQARQEVEMTHTFSQAVDLASAPEPEFRIPMPLTGAFAGMRYGMSGIDPKWIAVLRGRELAKNCIDACTKVHFILEARGVGV
jgi:hypothetical protein